MRDVSLAEIYRVLLAERGDKLVEVVRQLASPGTLPAIVFCSAGKDRTGLVSMLTLAAAGATESGIVADYAATERNMAEAFREKLMPARSRPGSPSRRLRSRSARRRH